MKFFLYQVGDHLPGESKTAVSMLNKFQTIWRLQMVDKIQKVKSYDPDENISVLPTFKKDSNSFAVGITAGNVTQGHKIALMDNANMRALISEYEWRSLKNYDPAEVFWAFALANVCFQSSINSCSKANCLGFNGYTVKQLLLNLIELHICNECREKLTENFKYRIPEIENMIEVLKKPLQFESTPILNKPFLPTFDCQIDRLKRAGKNTILQDYGIITIMHYLENLVSFVEGLTSLGAKKESMVLIVKPYPYSQRTAVHAYLHENYPEIRVEYLDILPPSDDLLRELAEFCKDKSPSGKVLVIEDGGYLVPFLHKNYSEEENFCIGAVEQTTKGIRKDEDVEEEFRKVSKQLFFPIINVAKSNFKDEYESPLVGRSVVHGIQKILSEEHFSGKKALVVGFGAVGREVANALAKQLGMIVRVYDSALEKIAAARVRGYEASQELSSLAKGVKVIIGTTGETSITSDVLKNMGDGTILVSASSDQIEIDLDHLKKMAPSLIPKLGIGTEYIRKEGNSEDKYTLVADGFPINFYFGAGIPTRSIDPVLAQLLIGAVYIAEKHDELPKGISEIMNDLISHYELLKDFIDTYDD